jgi:hypothetical protein
MMKVYLVSYDLKKPGKDYEGLYKELKSASSWWHYLESSWLLKTNLTADQWFDKIKTHLDENDFVLIIEVGKDSQGWLPPKAWEWIQKNI